MRLLTHNNLLCPATRTFPLRLIPTEVEQEETDFNAEFVIRLITKLEYGVLLKAAQSCGIASLPSSLPRDGKLTQEQDGELLQLLHTVLLDTHVMAGHLENKEGRKYLIQQGIPNMRLNEDEV